MDSLGSKTQVFDASAPPETSIDRETSRHSAAIDKWALRLRWLRFLLTCKISKVRLETILRGASVSGLEIPSISDHHETPTLYEQLVLATLVRVLNPKRCFEIGTSLGLTTCVMAANSSSDCRIDTLDVSSDVRIGSAFRDTPAALKIQQHVASSAEFSYEPYKGKIDLIFVDGSHEFKDVSRDTVHAISMLSSRGVALWHDISPDFPGVVRALENCEVSKAIRRIKDTSLGIWSKPGSFDGLVRSNSVS